MIYLDSSALMKLVRAQSETETEALREWLALRPEQPVVTSELGRVEVLRAARRIGSRVLAEASLVVGDLDLLPLDRAVQDLACEIGEPVLRTLDALHLASALLLSEQSTAFVAYDQLLTNAARAAGLVVVVPGRWPPSESSDGSGLCEHRSVHAARIYAEGETGGSGRSCGVSLH